MRAFVGLTQTEKAETAAQTTTKSIAARQTNQPTNRAHHQHERAIAITACRLLWLRHSLGTTHMQFARTRQTHTHKHARTQTTDAREQPALFPTATGAVVLCDALRASL